MRAATPSRLEINAHSTNFDSSLLLFARFVRRIRAECEHSNRTLATERTKSARTRRTVVRIVQGVKLMAHCAHIRRSMEWMDGCIWELIPNNATRTRIRIDTDRNPIYGVLGVRSQYTWMHTRPTKLHGWPPTADAMLKACRVFVQYSQVMLHGRIRPTPTTALVMQADEGPDAGTERAMPCRAGAEWYAGCLRSLETRPRPDCVLVVSAAVYSSSDSLAATPSKGS